MQKPASINVNRIKGILRFLSKLNKIFVNKEMMADDMGGVFYIYDDNGAAIVVIVAGPMSSIFAAKLIGGDMGPGLETIEVVCDRIVKVGSTVYCTSEGYTDKIMESLGRFYEL